MPKLKKAGQAGAKVVAQDREVLFQEVVIDICQGETALTADDARELLGWEDAQEGGGRYVREIFALAKIKCRCIKNMVNRPITVGNVKKLKQEILKKRWCGPCGSGGTVNGEPIIIGRTGLLLNGQHTLIALVLSNHEWAKDPERYPDWPTPPTIDKVVVSGVDECDRVVNTMDTCKPRSLYDVLCRSSYFAALKEGDRKKMCRMADYAIKLSWHRTGVELDAFSAHRTHAEALAFFEAHPKLVDACKHIHEEDGSDGKITKYVNPGHAACLLYLMGSSTSDPAEYRSSPDPDESTLDWSCWSDACDFWVEIAGGDKGLAAISRTMAKLIEETGSISNAERWAIITNAWIARVNHKPATIESLLPDYDRDEDGKRRLADHPSVGGIDLGDPSTADEINIVAADPTPDEIAREIGKMKTNKGGGKDKGTDKHPKAKAEKLGPPTRSGPNWAKDDVAWVSDPGGAHFLAKLTEDPWDCDDGDCRVMVRTSKGEEWEVGYGDLGLAKPTDDAEPETRPRPTKTKKTAKASADWAEGQRAWIDADEPWRGLIIATSKRAVKIKVDTGFQGAGTIRTVQIGELLRDQPDLPEDDAA
jgi:hypothetical protein